jgi:uncharacterized protein YciI
VFKGVDEGTVEEFVREDPYVRAGLVPAWHVARWSLI